MRQRFIELLNNAYDALDQAQEHTNNNWEMRHLQTIKMMIDEIIDDEENK